MSLKYLSLKHIYTNRINSYTLFYDICSTKNRNNFKENKDHRKISQWIVWIYSISRIIFFVLKLSKLSHDTV